MKQAMIKITGLAIALLCLCQSTHCMQALRKKQEQILEKESSGKWKFETTTSAPPPEKRPLSHYYSSKSMISAELAKALEASAQEYEKEQAKKLAPGIYVHKSDQGILFNQLALETEDAQEENITCGVRVLTIAKAIDMLVQKNTPITAASMHTMLQALDYKTQIAECARQLSSTDFSSWMQKNNNKLKLNAWTILGSQEGTLIPQAKTDEYDVAIIDILSNSDDIPGTLRKLVEELFAEWFSLTPANPTSHCFCTDRASAHWFLISAVLSKGSIQIWYVDPRNTDYNEYPAAHLFMNYITALKRK